MECNNQNSEDVKSVAATGLSLSAVPHPGYKMDGCPWLVSRPICTTHFYSVQLVSQEVSAEPWPVPGNSLGKETENPSPPKVYSLIRKGSPLEGRSWLSGSTMRFTQASWAPFAHWSCQSFWEGE